MAKPAVVVDHVSILFNLNSEKIDNIKEDLLRNSNKYLDSIINNSILETA